MKRGLIIAAFVSALSGCLSDSGSDPIATAEIVLSAPDRSIRAVTADELSAEVLIDGTLYSLQSQGSVWRGAFSLPTDRELTLLVRWLYGDLPVATHETTIGPLGDGNTALSIDSADYITTGTAFDADADGISNLQELVDCSGPEDPLNVNVSIPALADGTSIGINGISGAVWADNIITDLCGGQLSIDNLMIDQRASLADGETDFYWQAVHNGQSLFIIVYAEDAATATPFGDSNVAERDDALHIFIDGDNSKLNSYDGINDFHITIPLLKRTVPADNLAGTLMVDSTGDSTFDDQGNISIITNTGLSGFAPAAPAQANHIRDDDGRISFGPLSDRLSGLVFQNGLPDNDQQIYEIQIPLDALDISVNQPFGFEIQIDDDTDGGDKNARYGWKHPSRQANGPDINNTVNNPSFMGTAILEGSSVSAPVSDTNINDTDPATEPTISEATESDGNGVTGSEGEPPESQDETVSTAVAPVSAPPTPPNPQIELSDFPQMTLIPAGRFQMGRAEGIDEGARRDDEVLHEVTIENDFFMSVHEVTWDQYILFAGSPGVVQDVPSDQGVGMGPRPIVNITWEDAVAYTDWLSGETGDTYRLPTEAEWEYAARAGTQTRFWTGDMITSQDENYNSADIYVGGVFSQPFGIPLPVGSLRPNPFGLYDMLGNVQEFTCSGYDANYLNGVETRCTTNTNDVIVVRGADFKLGPSWARSSNRNTRATNYRDFEHGFRVVRE